MAPRAARGRLLAGQWRLYTCGPFWKGVEKRASEFLGGYFGWAVAFAKLK
jgi:hypothetical protein